jgi:hypothetical protein
MTMSAEREKMAVVVELPAEVETTLRAEHPDLDRIALESLALDWFRSERITHYQLRTMLGLTRSQTDAFLRSRDEWAQSPTLDDFERDAATSVAIMSRQR